MAVIEITDTNFDEEVVASSLPVLVDFTATWCGPCRLVKPIVEKLADECEGRLRVGAVDVDRNPGCAARFAVRSIPSLMVFKGGEVVEQVVGAVPEAHLRGMIDKVVG